MYEVRILDEAIRDLKRLDKPVAQRIVKRINWLAENLGSIIKSDAIGVRIREILFTVLRVKTAVQEQV